VLQFCPTERAEVDGAELAEPLANREGVTHAEEGDDPAHGGRLAIRLTDLPRIPARRRVSRSARAMATAE
jgi:hypothetical protein